MTVIIDIYKSYESTWFGNDTLNDVYYITLDYQIVFQFKDI